VTSTLKHDITI